MDGTVPEACNWHLLNLGRWQHVRMNPVQWFFIVGGAVFLFAALFLREMNNEGARIAALTFGLIGFFWLVPQLIIVMVRNRRR